MTVISQTAGFFLVSTFNIQPLNYPLYRYLGVKQKQNAIFFYRHLKTRRTTNKLTEALSITTQTDTQELFYTNKSLSQFVFSCISPEAMTPVSKPKTMVAPTTGKAQPDVARCNRKYQGDDVEVESLLTYGMCDDEKEDDEMCEARDQAVASGSESAWEKQEARNCWLALLAALVCTVVVSTAVALAFANGFHIS